MPVVTALVTAAAVETLEQAAVPRSSSEPASRSSRSELTQAAVVQVLEAEAEAEQAAVSLVPAHTSQPVELERLGEPRADAVTSALKSARAVPLLGLLPVEAAV